ncbi:MAG: hypothetical protein R3B48_16630 [Kofleriaceae bacterium]
MLVSLRRLTPCALWIATLGCGDDLAPTPDAAAGAEDPQGYQPARVGLIHLLGGPGGSVEARLFDQPDPLAPVLRGEHGACKLYQRPSEAVCTLCTGVCVEPERCVAAPAPQSAGTITVSGLRQSLEFRPRDFGYETAAPSGGDDLFDVGARIRVSASGDAVAPFSVALSGVPPLQPGAPRVVLERERDTRVTWTAAGVGRVALVIVNRAPGSAEFSSMLLCETEDYGTLTIGRALAVRLPEPRAEEEQVATIARVRRAVVALGSGPLEVVVGYRVRLALVRPPL